MFQESMDSLDPVDTERCKDFRNCNLVDGRAWLMRPYLSALAGCADKCHLNWGVVRWTASLHYCRHPAAPRSVQEHEICLSNCVARIAGATGLRLR